MNILVMGAGAIGSVAGGLLARVGHRVSLVGSEPHISAIRQKGLFIGGILSALSALRDSVSERTPILCSAEGPPEGADGPSGPIGRPLVGEGPYTITHLGAYLHPGEVPWQPFDLVLLSTKAYDTETALRQALPLVGGDSLVVSLQNGLGNVETIASLVGEGRTVGGRVMYGAQVVAPGRVEVTTLGGDLVLGSPEGAIPLPRIEALAGVFRGAGLAASATEDIMGFLWGKLLYNCCLNPLSALLGVSYGKLGENSSTRAIITEVIQEVFAVARSLRRALLWSSPEEYEAILFGELIPRTAAHFASMYADLRRGKRTEIDALNGAVWRLGRENAVPTPTNACLTLRVKARERPIRCV